MNHAKQYFDQHKTTDTIFCTSDELLFHDRQAANDHAARLEDDTLIALSRREVEAAIEDMNFEGWEEIPEYTGFFEPEDE